MKKLLLVFVFFLAGCGINITIKAESTESPQPINQIKVEFVQSSKTPYKIQKYGKATNMPKITEEDKQAARESVAIFLQSLSKNVKDTLSEKFRQNNIPAGDGYILNIYLDEILISVGGNPQNINFPNLLNIKYSAVLYRTSDQKELWKASFRRPNGSTSPEDLKKTEADISEGIFSEFNKSGWMK